MREIIVKITIDWEDYGDVSKELILEDTGIYDSLKEGVNIEILRENETNEL